MDTNKLLNQYAAGERNFNGANLHQANLSDADLKGVNLGGADLSGADLSRADLSGADLSRSNLTDADLNGANLKDANLSELTLPRLRKHRFARFHKKPWDSSFNQPTYLKEFPHLSRGRSVQKL